MLVYESVRGLGIEVSPSGDTRQRKAADIRKTRALAPLRSPTATGTARSPRRRQRDSLSSRNEGAARRAIRPTGEETQPQSCRLGSLVARLPGRNEADSPAASGGRR